MESQNISPRVSVVFTDEERELLKAICNADRRPPVWTLRQLVVEEAKRRGLEKHNGAAHAMTGECGAEVMMAG